MNDWITIVSGLPRSGTSMMMQMLAAGGMDTATDDVRAADPDNPRGYCEFERVKTIKEDASWLPELRGKAVKMVSMLLFDLPGDSRYRIVFMHRDMDEILASQAKMLERRGKGGGPGDGRMAGAFDRHLDEVTRWLAAQDNMEVLYVQHGETIANPGEIAAKVNAFLGSCLDEEKMAAAVDPSLYRNRGQPA
jgi:hypothetical protein